MLQSVPNNQIVDLLHSDIQGAELDVFLWPGSEAVMAELDHKVAAVHIGIHGGASTMTAVNEVR